MRALFVLSLALLASAVLAQSTSTVKTVYVYAGAADILQLDELRDSFYKLGKTIQSGDTIYDRPTTASGSPVVLGASLRFCSQLYLDKVFDAAEYAVVGAYPAYSSSHERALYEGDTSIAGFGSFECAWTLALADGHVSLKGLLERRPSVASRLAIVGGTGAYTNVRGEAKVTAVDAASCANVAFRSSSVASDCQLKIELGLVTLTRPAPVTNVVSYEYAGAQEITKFSEVAASRFKLGDRATFGNPVTDGFQQVGYTGGNCYPVFLDSSDPFYSGVYSAPGYHGRPGNQGKGALLCELSIVYFPSGDSLALQGLVESDVSLASSFAIIGGTGRFQNSKGSAVRTAVDPARCVASAGKATSVVADCVFKYDLNVIVNANDPYTDVAGGFVFYEYGGSTVPVNFPEVKASTFALGQSFYFGGPLKTDIPANGAQRIGFDGGYCWKVYLDKAWDHSDLGSPAGTRGLPGDHSRPGTLAYDGAWMCYWTSHYREGSITQMGIFADSGKVANTFAVVGGIGAYSNSTGFMYDELSNPNHCFVNGFAETSVVEACLYRKRYTLLALN